LQLVYVLAPAQFDGDQTSLLQDPQMLGGRRPESSNQAAIAPEVIWPPCACRADKIVRRARCASAPNTASNSARSAAPLGVCL
jgi:hypothetical protein